VTPEELVAQSNRIVAEANPNAVGALIEARELTRVYAGEASSFYGSLANVNENADSGRIIYHVRQTLEAFARYVAAGLLNGVSLHRQAEIDVVSDILGQAHALLQADGVHPAAAAMLAGASLEEFLRSWCDDVGLDLGDRKPGIDAYCALLRQRDLIDKQGVKDVTSWAGLRNHAAHGEWDKVEDASRIANMVEGVGLFIRRSENARSAT
jgi:hypothetical protein